MCFFITVKPGLGRKEGQDLAAWLTSNTSLRVSASGKGSSVLHFSPDGGCACSMLSDAADWNAATWALREDALPKLADALASFANKHGAEFTFEAMWGGDDAISEQPVTLEQLLRDVATNQVRNRFTYRVVVSNVPDRHPG